MLSRLYHHHVLANLTFLLVIFMGVSAYQQMPREQDPNINFNWIQVITLFPSATAEDVEQQVTNTLEDHLQGLPDMRFISSNSRQGVSSLLLRFNDIDEYTYDKHLSDLRRRIQDAKSSLPKQAFDPKIHEISTANAFPSATIAIVGQSDNETLRYHANLIKKDLEQFVDIDKVLTTGLNEPEMVVAFDPVKLQQKQLNPRDIQQTIQQHFQDKSLGSLSIQQHDWLARITGKHANPAKLSQLPILYQHDFIPLGELASIHRAREKPVRMASYQQQPAIILSINKKGGSNTLTLVKKITAYIQKQNQLRQVNGIQLHLIDDQTLITRTALQVMQTNALLGFILVLLVTWLFLGSHMAFFTTIGIPFVLAGTFGILFFMGQTLNVVVLMGIVIALGMLVDDAVVVVESIYYQLQRGATNIDAIQYAIKEAFAPVTASVLTTMAAFLPLMLLPGIMGEFMFVVPLVVTLALLVSLIEAYWILPAHILSSGLKLQGNTGIQRQRKRLLKRIRQSYTRRLIRSLRHTKWVLSLPIVLFMMALVILSAENLQHPFNDQFEQKLAAQYAEDRPPAQAAMDAKQVTQRINQFYPSDSFKWLATHGIDIDFFANDPIRLFYINVDMPPRTPLKKTLSILQALERKIQPALRTGEVRGMVSYAGIKLTETEPFFGNQYGQIFISLHPLTPQLRGVDEMVEALRPLVVAHHPQATVSFLTLSGGPPTSSAIKIKVRGNELQNIRQGVQSLKHIIRSVSGTKDIRDDDIAGQMEIQYQINLKAAHHAGIAPEEIRQTLALLLDGTIVAQVRDHGEQVNIRIKAHHPRLTRIQQIADFKISLKNGQQIPLNQLLDSNIQTSSGNIRHYNFRRTITVEANIDKNITNTLSVNRQIMHEWHQIKQQYPELELDQTGELDDINETLDSIAQLFLFGIGLMYLILGTQFKSYFQPLLILSTVPMAFIGVIIGLLITGHPLSLYTLYGVVALAGISVNNAIVLITTANRYIEKGLSPIHATLYAAKRRVIPIMITSLTTIAGLFSMAVGLGGTSLMWGPIATAIVWGLMVSSLLTLFVIPALYLRFNQKV